MQPLHMCVELTQGLCAGADAAEGRNHCHHTLHKIHHVCVYVYISVGVNNSVIQLEAHFIKVLL